MNAPILCYYDVWYLLLSYIVLLLLLLLWMDTYDRWMDDIFRRSKIFFPTPRKSVRRTFDNMGKCMCLSLSVHQTEADESASVYLSVDIFHCCTRCLSVDKFHSEFYQLSVRCQIRGDRLSVVNLAQELVATHPLLPNDDRCAARASLFICVLPLQPLPLLFAFITITITMAGTKRRGGGSNAAGRGPSPPPAKQGRPSNSSKAAVVDVAPVVDNDSGISAPTTQADARALSSYPAATAVAKASTMPTTPNDPNPTVPETTLSVSKLPCTCEQYDKNVKKHLEENEVKTKIVRDRKVLAAMKEITEVYNGSGVIEGLFPSESSFDIPPPNVEQLAGAGGGGGNNGGVVGKLNNIHINPKAAIAHLTF